MTFSKYKRYGGYHWKWYGYKKKYIDNVNFIKDWVKEKSVLDIGAGDGLITSIVGATGMDLDKYAIRAAGRRGVKIDHGSAYNLPYADEQFDSVMMIDVLEHLQFPEMAIAECRRVMKEYLYIATPRRKTSGELVEGWHFREYTENELRDFLKNNGFSEVELFTNNKIIYAKFRK